MSSKRVGGRKREPGSSRPASRPAAMKEIQAGKDYTAEILDFLRGVHGKIRLDREGDFYYEHVSTISIHFLFRSQLPAKELLWCWYRYFEEERGESIYQTLPPQKDEEFLTILSDCAFRWNPDIVRSSGLVFLPEHRAEFLLALEELMSMRLDAYETMDDEELAEVLRPHGSWSDIHLRKLVRNIQTRPLSISQRQAIYTQFESDYLKATVRHLLDEAQTDKYWKSPPAELEGLHSRFIIFSRTMANTARRLGVYVSRKDYEGRPGRGTRGGTRKSSGGAGAGRGTREYPDNGNNSRHLEASYFEALGLEPTASLEQVRAAYREKVKRHHPDQGGSAQDFLQLQEAYEFLLTQVF